MTLPNLPASTTLPMLIALQRKPVYQGTADPAGVAANRRRNKAARRARAASRKANFRKGVR